MGASAAVVRSAAIGNGPRGGRFSVEVRGVEPRSSEASAPASPSAADSEFVGRRDSIGEFPAAVSGIGLARRSRNPGGGIPQHDARSIGEGTQPANGLR